MTKQQTAMILAALNHWQLVQTNRDDFANVASGNGEFEPLTDEEIDELKEQLSATVPMIHNKGTENEVTMRVVLASDACGNEYFDHNETLDEALESVRSIVLNCLKGTPDAFDRVVGIAVVPKEQYGAEDGFGYGLSPDYSDSVSDKGGFAFFDEHEDSDACNSFMDDTALGIDDDGYVLDGDDERMTYKAFQDYDCGF